MFYCRIISQNSFPRPDKCDKWLIPKAKGKVLEVGGGSGKEEDNKEETLA
jgi:hypothetical protein